MSIISWKLEDFKPIAYIGHHYSRKMFGVETEHKSGEWKSLITHRDYYELIVEVNEIKINPLGDVKTNCISCPALTKYIYYSNVTYKLGSFMWYWLFCFFSTFLRPANLHVINTIY